MIVLRAAPLSLCLGLALMLNAASAKRGIETAARRTTTVRQIVTPRDTAPVSVIIVAQKTAAPRGSDERARSAGQAPGRSPAAAALHRQTEDRYFMRRARQLARRVGALPSFAPPPDVIPVETGAALLATLVSASRRGSIANVVIYGHSGPDGLYMLEDRGFYVRVSETAEKASFVSGSEAEKEARLRALGARDLSDLSALINSGAIRLSGDLVILFTGCSAGGEFEVEPSAIGAQIAALTGAQTTASVGAVDYSMAGGRIDTHEEYSRRRWVRFVAGTKVDTLPGRKMDPMLQLSTFVAAPADAAPSNRDVLFAPAPLH